MVSYRQIEKSAAAIIRVRMNGQDGEVGQRTMEEMCTYTVKPSWEEHVDWLAGPSLLESKGVR